MRGSFEDHSREVTGHIIDLKERMAAVEAKMEQAPDTKKPDEKKPERWTPKEVKEAIAEIRSATVWIVPVALAAAHALGMMDEVKFRALWQVVSGGGAAP